MIVQSAPAGERHFVIRMREHTALAGQVARAFGNDRFEAVKPRDVVLDLIDNHDRGWDDWDEAPGADPLTNMPYSLARTPLDIILKTNVASPEFNERRHAYAGLLSSMHSFGLYNGRFGFSDHIALDNIAPEFRPGIDAMLEAEQGRRTRLTEALRADEATASWVAKDHLFQNYKQLQFFDTLALYFNMKDRGQRTKVAFTHVPLDAETDVTIEITPRGGDTYGLAPYPFEASPLTVSFEGRYMRPLKPGDGRELSDVLADIPVETQQVTLIAA